MVTIEHWAIVGQHEKWHLGLDGYDGWIGFYCLFEPRTNITGFCLIYVVLRWISWVACMLSELDCLVRLKLFNFLSVFEPTWR